MAKTAGNGKNWKRRALAFMIAFSMTVQQGGITFGEENPEAVQLTVQEEANTEAEAKAKAEAEAAAAQAQAEAEAAKVVARPGTSEHQTGLAVDFNSTTNAFETMPQYKWLKENAEDYGFIMRYPSDKEDITKIVYEPWHWRFVGIKVAREMNSLGVTLEEYLDR